MKKALFMLIGLFVGIAAFSQTSLYVNPDFDVISIKHRIIGIVPFKASVTLRPKQMKDITLKQLVRIERAEGKSIQAAMYSWFLKREEMGTLTVKIQAPMVTNAKLKKKGITIDNYEEYTPKQLAELLELDAVIMGAIETNMPMSEGALIVLGLKGDSYGKNNKSIIDFFIYNAKDGELLVNYNRGVPGSRANSMNELVNVLMINASRRIAYTKK